MAGGKWQVPWVEGQYIPAYVSRIDLPATTLRIWSVDYPIDWQDPKPFGASLKFGGFRRGRSAAHSIWFYAVDESDLGKSLPFTIFLTDLEDIMRKGALFSEPVFGVWKPVKRGQNYGIVLYEGNF